MGGDLCFFYTDAYIPTLGIKHPTAFGRPFRDVWREVYADVEAQVHSVMVEGQPTWNKALLLLLERNGYREETYHTFSYSALRDGDAIRGLMCIVTEETERVISERRLETVRRLGEHLIGATTPEGVRRAVCETLAANTTGFPFALAWMRDEIGRLVGCAATDEARPMPQLSWPLDETAAGGQDFRLDEDAAYPTGAWATPPTRALILPVRGRRGGVAATLALGPNPYRRGEAGLFDLTRPHAGIGGLSPWTRVNNLLGNDT